MFDRRALFPLVACLIASPQFAYGQIEITSAEAKARIQLDIEERKAARKSETDKLQRLYRERSVLNPDQRLSDVVDRAARQIEECQDPVVQSYIAQPGVIEVLLDHVRVAIMDHCNLPYPEYVPAPWPKVAKYLAPATVEALGIIPPHHRNLSYAVALELIDPAFDDTF